MMMHSHAVPMISWTPGLLDSGLWTLMTTSPISAAAAAAAICGFLILSLSLPCISAFSLNSRSSHQSSSSSPPSPPSVVCVGETLYDSLPDAIFLGGALTNVAVHLASLGVPAAVASCVGEDRLGDEAIRRVEAKGVDTALVQRHSELGTGMVIATIDEAGDAKYEFDTPAAWDGLALTDELQNVVQNITKVTVMGTIASRLGSSHGATSAASISAIRNLGRENTVVMDVNLRPPWFEPGDVLKLCRGRDDADGGGGAKQLAMVKLNDEELSIVEAWCGLDECGGALSGDGLKQRMEALSRALNACRVCVTRGADGAALFCRDCDDCSEIFVENTGYTCESEPGSDTVGAGDSFLAALIRSLLLENEPPEKALDSACALGGFVASCRGAVPDHRKAPDELRKIFSY